MSYIENILKSIHYSHKKSFLSSYGGDLAISILTIYIFSIAIMYFYVINHIPIIRKKWPTEKCNPLYMPFAGLVLKKSKKSSLKLIEDNFAGCVHNILYSISQDALAPLYYAKKISLEGIDDAIKAVHDIRAFFNKIRNDISDTVESVMGRTLNIMMPPLHMAVSTKDSISKVKGLYTSGVYFMMGNYIMMQSIFKNLIHIIVVLILLVIVGIIIGLMFIPFIGEALAAPLIALAIAIIVPTVIIIAKVNNVFKMNVSSDMPHW
tara:strand:+ start:1012 stop:1803 length:792 start_codon:yes stop_codon:yes gene_type:complete